MAKGGLLKVRPLPKKFKMRITTKLLIFIIIFGLTFLAQKIRTQEIVVTGSWTLTIDALDLQAGAGSDLIDTYESALDQVSIDVTVTGNRNWRVDVRKGDTNWHSDFELSVRRTSDGTGPGTVAGGTSYQIVTDTDQSFFSGRRNKFSINVQLKLSGVSIQILPDNHATEVYYTIVDLG